MTVREPTRATEIEAGQMLKRRRSCSRAARFERLSVPSNGEPSGSYMNYRIPVAAFFGPRNRAAFEKGPSPAERVRTRSAAERARARKAERQASEQAAR